MMGSIPRRNYTDLYNEVNNTSNPELLKKISLKLLDEHKRMAQENKKNRFALDQIHLLVHKLYSALDDKMSEMRLLKKCLALSQGTRDVFLKDFTKSLGNFDAEFQKIFNSLSCDPKFGFLSQTMNSATCNLMVTKFMLMHYLDNYKKFDSEFSEKPNLEKCLGFLDKAIQFVMKMMESFNGIFGGPSGSNINRKRKRESNSMENYDVKRRNLQDADSEFPKYKYGKKMESNKDSKITQIRIPGLSNSKVDVELDTTSMRPVVELIDILNDPVAECDFDVLHYKQTNFLKDNEDIEYKVLDDAGVTSEEETISNDKTNPVDSETYVETQPCISSSELNMDVASNSGSNAHSQGEENEEQESTSVRSYNCDDDETKAQGNSKSNYPEFHAMGPCTPPTLSPEQCGRGPHTPPPPSPIQALEDTDQEKDHSESFASPSSGSDSDFDDDADDTHN